MKQQALVRHFLDMRSLSVAAARYVAEIIQGAVRKRGFATLVLSGGTTPRGLYMLLATPEYKNSISWEKCIFFWGDERCVPSNSQNSNYAMAYEIFLSKVPAIPENLYRIPVELGWAQSAAVYETMIKQFFISRSGSNNVSFDLVLLGIGTDGHTASIFPGSPALYDMEWVSAVAAPVGMPHHNRVTMTVALLNKADRVLFLAGADKKEIIEEIFEGSASYPAGYPAGKIKAKQQLCVFVADEDNQKQSLCRMADRH